MKETFVWHLGKNIKTHLMTYGLMTWQGVPEPEQTAFLPENDALQVEWVLYDPCSGDAHPEHILLSGKIVGICNTIQIGKITTGRPVREETKRDREKKRQKNNYIKRERQLPQPPAIPGSVEKSCRESFQDKARVSEMKGR